MNLTNRMTRYFVFFILISSRSLVLSNDGTTEFVDADIIRQQIESCSGPTADSLVLRTYISQVEYLDYEDDQQYSFVINDEIMSFVLKSLHTFTSGMTRCHPLQESYLEAIKIVEHNITNSSLNRSNTDRCSPLETWRSCVVSADGGLNLRKMPGVVDDISRIDGFLDGEKVKATCTFGNWALVYGDVFDKKHETYGWSHRSFLVCEPDLGRSESNWKG